MKWLNNAIVCAVISAVVSGGISYYAASFSHIKSTRVERVVEFNSAGDQLVVLAGEYISAIVNEKSVESVELKFRTEIAKQLKSADELKLFFPKEYNSLILSYQDTLTSFASTMPEADSPLRMKEWVEGFGKLNDARIELTKGLLRSTGIENS